MPELEFDFVRVEPENSDWLYQIQVNEQLIFLEGGENLWSLRPMAAQQQVLAAIIDTKVFAHAIVWRNWNDPATAYLHSFIVHPAKQGIGLGRLFYRKLKEFLLCSQIDKLQLTIKATNHIASKIYLSESKLLKEYFIKDAYGLGEDRWHWTLDLQI